MIPYPDFLPSTLAAMTRRWWQFPRHLQLLERAALALLTDPDVNRVIVEMPVRHGKTSYACWALLSWFALCHPDKSAILASYEKSFSCEWLVKVRDTVESYGPRLTGVSLGGIGRQDHFTLSGYAGDFRAASPSSGIAGKGAWLIVADDLVKDVNEVVSPARRHKLATWFASELESRLEPDGKMLVIMSRRHPDDQSGRLQAMNADLEPHLRWHVLRMPALMERDGTEQALWPERFGVKRLHEIKRGFELDGKSYLWDCLYQQDARGDSSLCEWPESYWKGIGYDEIPTTLPTQARLLALDPSKGTDAKTGDYSAWVDCTLDTVGVRWITPYLDVINTEAVEDFTVTLIARALNEGKPYHAVVVECNAFQELIAVNVIRKCRERAIPCPMHKKYSVGNKEVRIRLGLGPLFEQRLFRINARARAYKLALSQLKEFPTAAHDDFPDALNLLCDLIDSLLTARGESKQNHTHASASGVMVYTA